MRSHGADASRELSGRPRRSLPPKTQANLLGVYSVLYTGVFSIFAYFFGPKWLPSWRYFAVLGVLYFVAWLPFYFPGLSKFAKTIGRLFLRLGVLLSITSVDDAERAKLVATPPEEPGSFFAPTQVDRPARLRWPFTEAVQVQLLAAGMIVMAAWYTAYSGGPFESPFGQILLALPLLSPNVASSSSSILGAFLVTVAAAGLFAWLARPIDQLPSEGWYAATAIGVLVIAGFVSWAVRRTDETVARHPGKASRPPTDSA